MFFSTSKLPSSAPESTASGEIYLLEGLIIGAKSGADAGRKALTVLSGAADGNFEVEKNTRTYDRTIQATNNTALILDLLRVKDEEDHGISTIQ